MPTWGTSAGVQSRKAWMSVVLPALLLCYAGQAALVLDNPMAMGQASLPAAPGWALWPMLVLATAATVIASQSAITGAFSITAQAIQLGYLPRLLIRHTSAAERGQIFAPAVNAVLCAGSDRTCPRIPIIDSVGRCVRLCRDVDHGADDVMMGFVIFRSGAGADLGRPALRDRRPLMWPCSAPPRPRSRWCLAAPGDRRRADAAVYHLGTRPDPLGPGSRAPPCPSSFPARHGQ